MTPGAEATPRAMLTATVTGLLSEIAGTGTDTLRGVIGASEAFEHDDASLWTPQPAILEAARARDAKAVAKSLASARQRLEKRLVSH